MYAFTDDILQAVLRDSCEDPICKTKTAFLRRLDDAVRLNVQDLDEGDWVPEPLALFLGPDVVDKVLGRNLEENNEDDLANAVNDTPSVIRAGIHHRYSDLIYG